MAKRKYFNANRMTGFEWDVQPYRWLEEMRNNYTEVVIAATKYKMDERAAEATQWMQQNAVWTDRTPAERTRQDGRNHQSARKGLKAEVQYTDSELDKLDLGRKFAENADARLLSAINAQRKKAADERDKITQEKAQDRALTVARRGGMSADEVKTVTVKSSYIPIRKLQESESNVPAFEKAFKKDLRLIGNIKFHYNKYRKYAIWLEVANGGRFGIINRALQYWSAKLHQDIKTISNLKQFSITIGHDVTHASTQSEQFEEYALKEARQTGRQYKPFSRAAQNERNRRRRGRKKLAAKMAR